MHEVPTLDYPEPGMNDGDCFDLLCGYGVEHVHGWVCTTDCSCGQGGMNHDGTQAQ